MPKFVYKAKKGPGQIVTGTMEAENIDGAVSKIIQLGLAPIDVSAETQEKKEAPKKMKAPSLFSSRRIKSTDITTWTRQLGDLVDAGVPLLQALSVIHNQTFNPAFKEIVDQIHNYVRDGGALSEALAQHPDIFARLYVSMVKSGEISGNLSLILNRLAEFADKDQEIRAKVSASLIYPSLILVVGILTIFALLTFVIPRLTVMFDDLAQSIPLPTLILMNISQLFAKFWWLVVGLVGLGIFYIRKSIHTPDGKMRFDQLKLKLPVFGAFIQNVEIGRFARTLATLLDSGVVIVSALESVWSILDNEVIKEDIKKVSDKVASGGRVSDALRECIYFPETAKNMIAVGEESGHLEKTLYKLADVYERQSDQSIKAVTSLIEPLLIVLIGSVVGFIVIALLLPIFRMNLIIQ